MFALIARTQQTTMLDGYIEYGAGDFDGQNSGHDFYGVSSPLPEEWPLTCGQKHAKWRGVAWTDYLATMLEADPCGLPPLQQPHVACLQGLLVSIVTRRCDSLSIQAWCVTLLLSVSLGCERL